jgi:hypothetical protein
MPTRVLWKGQGHEHFHSDAIAADMTKWLDALRTIDGGSGDTSNGLWSKTHGSPQSFKATIGSLLDGVAETLTPKSTNLLREGQGEQHRSLFNEPLGDPSNVAKGPCMPYDKRRVHTTQHMHVDKRGGYLVLKLGSNSTTKAPIYVRAHCLVHWALEGPQPNKPLVCHTCHNPKCLNPRHLAWSTARDNAPQVLRGGKGYAKVKKVNRMPAKTRRELLK